MSEPENVRECEQEIEMIAAAVATHEAVLLALRDELVELRILVDQNLIRIKLLERKESKKTS